MRTFYRLLSVFTALILSATGFLVASAHEGDVARITIHRVDSEDPVHPGDWLKFLVIVERLQHDIGIPTAVGSVYFYDADGDGELGVNDSQSASNKLLESALTADNPVAQLQEFEYRVHESELGDAQQRTIPVQFMLLIPATSLTDDGTQTDGHHGADVVRITSNIVDVVVTKDPGPDDGYSLVTVNVAMDRPDEIAAGEKVKFTVSWETGKFAVIAKPLIIRKQLKDEDGNDVGGAVPVSVFTLAALQSNSVSAEQSNEYTLVQDDIDAASVEFSYAVVIAATDLGYSIRAKPLPDDESQKGTFTLAPPAPEPEAMQDTSVGMTESATVTKGEGNLIDIERHDGGADFSLGVGILTADGMLEPHMNGYIRDNDLGQTYAVVNRESDDMIVRVWISSSSPHVGSIDWTSVLDFYNVPSDVLNAIPLDYMHPAPNQLVKAGDPIYVYTGGAWRHIPDIPTFQSRGYYWCDVTTASEGWAANVMLGQALPSSGGTPDPDYPNCR